MAISACSFGQFQPMRLRSPSSPGLAITSTRISGDISQPHRCFGSVTNRKSVFQVRLTPTSRCKRFNRTPPHPSGVRFEFVANRASTYSQSHNAYPAISPRTFIRTAQSPAPGFRRERAVTCRKPREVVSANIKNACRAVASYSKSTRWPCFFVAANRTPPAVFLEPLQKNRFFARPYTAAGCFKSTPFFFGP